MQELKQAETKRAQGLESAKLHIHNGSEFTSQTASSIPSALATNSHWATELGDTFMGTMCEPDTPSPEPSAPTSAKLDFLHAQLNGFSKDAVILERFNLLGPTQRRQGGACTPQPLGDNQSPPPPRRDCHIRRLHMHGCTRNVRAAAPSVPC